MGTFDSRVVAIAYYRSADFQEVLRKLRAKQSAARDAGDSKAVQALEAEGRRLQDLSHRQGFGTASTENLIQRIRDKLPNVSESAGVDAIASRWDIVFQKPEMAFVDVTDQLVQLFEPDEKTLEVIAQVRKTAPVPVDDLSVEK